MGYNTLEKIFEDHILQVVFLIVRYDKQGSVLVNMAEKMLLAAKRAGADAIKFQTFKAENLVTKTAPKAQY